MGGVNIYDVCSSSRNPRFATTGQVLSYKQGKNAQLKEAHRKAQEQANDKCKK